MPDLIESASSGRARCRGCGRAIPKGELRFGEALPNAYAEGEALYYYHLVCAACMRPENLQASLGIFTEPLEQRALLERLSAQGVAHPRLARLCRAERSPSARARCRSCKQIIDKGVMRFALQWYEEGRFSPMGSLHVSCAEEYFGTTDILDRIERLSPELDQQAALEVARLLQARLARTEAEGDSGASQAG